MTQKSALGYQDTPLIPGTQWHVHDGERPQPRVVTPGNLSRSAPVTPPSDAVVLFDGTNLEEWESCETGGPAPWRLVEGGAMKVERKTGHIRTKRHFGAMQLHVEWAAPEKVVNDGQGRGNSGVFLMELYEIQVLDSYDNPTYADGLCAAVYGQYPPLVNACCKPGEWHIYDILWMPPVFDKEILIQPAYLTLLHNGVVVHNHQKLMGPTRHKAAASYDAPHASRGPLMLQNHWDLVRYRNIWARELE